MDPMDTGPDPAGRTLAGRYLLEEEVASGGMGTVWRARDRVLSREVAVKVLHERLAREPDLLERFRLEAVAAARLSHPNVVRVFDTGIDDGVCFIVMELFDATTLESRLAEGPLPPAEAASIARGMLHGLAHAHREGVVHRDVKPGNVLIDRSGLVKVTDFGIAKAAFATSDLTTTGDLLGTARYLAPEQVDGGAVDHRADLYSSGIVLYEALTGRPPFEGRTHIATATMRLTADPPPPGAIRPGIPRALDAATMRALARDPNGRFQTAEEMSAALDRAAPAPRARGAVLSPNEPRPVRTSAFRSWMAVPLILVLLAALAVLGFTLAAPLFEDQGEGGGAAAGPPASARPLAITEATSFDPFGSDGEHDEDLPAATDGDPSTFWQTEGYTTADLGNAKPGVGIVFDLGQERSVGGLRLRTDSPGFLFSLYVGDDPTDFDPDGDSPVVSGEGEESFAAEDGLEVALESAEGRYVLLWITRLVAHDDYRALVNEVDLFPSGD
jgi:tRNA A-37 threonylcarbamoyl transferase component Bud32